MRIGRTLPPAASPIGLAEIAAGIRGMLRGRRELERFESELKGHFGVKHCFLLSSGKAALALTLLALKELHPGREEVLIPAFTCYTVPSSILRAGLRVKLCDLHPRTLDFDYGQLSTLLADSADTLLAVVPTHLFGLPSDLPRLRKLVSDPEVTIVEDAAQAMGEAREGRKLGTLGDVGFFSLARGKALSAVEGGIILTDRDDIAEVLRRQVSRLAGYRFWQVVSLVLKAVGLMVFTRPLFFWIPRAMPFLGLGQTVFDPDFQILRMSAFQAGLTADWSVRLGRMREARVANAGKWASAIGGSEQGGFGIEHPRSAALLRFPMRIRDARQREWLLRAGASSGAGIMPAYPEALNRVAGLKREPAEAFPVAESCARELVTLPTHGYVTQQDVAVIRRLLQALSAGKAASR